MIAGNPAFQDDGRTGADIVPDHVTQVVPDPAGNAHHLVDHEPDAAAQKTGGPRRQEVYVYVIADI